jgi:hypothetical protein
MKQHEMGEGCERLHEATHETKMFGMHKAKAERKMTQTE